VLAILTVIAGAALVHFAVFGGQGDVIGGWSLDAAQIRLGLTRLAFPFLAGMLLRRLYKGGSVKNAFLWSSLLVAAVLAFPRVGGSDNLWMNGIYDSLAIILMFPIIIYVGASGRIENTAMQKVCRFLGDISYPIYITHYAWIYLYYAWIQNNNVATQDAWPVGILVFIVSIVAAYAALKLYDAPVRKWLTERLIKR
jgi:peptidoglycan/LPS O-acetylase OafA/YrhL